MAKWPDLTVLELVVGVDDYGSLSAASRRVGLAQPNASRSIRVMERQLGMTLLQRSPTGSTLTPQGTVVAHWARRILAETRQMLEATDSLRAERRTALTVAASMTVAEHLVPSWLGTFGRLHPEVRIHLLVHNSAQVFEDVASGACDLGFVESPTIPRTLHSLTVARDELVVVVRPQHPWTRRRQPISIAELASTSLLVREPGSGTRITLDLALAEYPRAAPLLELGSAAAIRTSVLAGMGPSVMSTLAVADQVKAGEMKIVPVQDLVLHRALRAVWNGPRQLSGPEAELVRLVRSQRTSQN